MPKHEIKQTYGELMFDDHLQGELEHIFGNETFKHIMDIARIMLQREMDQAALDEEDCGLDSE